VGGSSKSGAAAHSQLKRESPSQLEKEAGHGMLVIDSSADLMPGFQSQGGSTDYATRTGGAGLYVMKKSTVNVRGGRLDGGLNNVDSTLNGPSIVVDGADSIVHIHEGTFYGKWELMSGGTIVVHACSFTIDNTVVHATLVDGSQIDIPCIDDGSGNITSTVVQECDESLASKGDDALANNAITHSSSDTPTPSLPTEVSSTFQLPPTDLAAAAAAPTESPTVATSRIQLERPPIPGYPGATNTPQPTSPGAVKSTTFGPSKPTPLSLQLDVEDLIVLDENVVVGNDRKNNGKNSSGRGSNVSIVAGSLMGAALLFFMDIF